MITYINDGIFSLSSVLVFSTPIWAFVNLAWLFLRGTKAVVQRRLFIKEYIFLTYILLLGKITGFFDWGVGRMFGSSFNFLPFTDLDPSQLILNIVVFLPLGILAPMILRRINTTMKMAITAFLLSMTIETIQFFFLSRAADIDDVITNTLGGICGYLIFLIGTKLLDKYK